LLYPRLFKCAPVLSSRIFIVLWFIFMLMMNLSHSVKSIKSVSKLIHWHVDV
jgi:hypothetical protein